MPAAAAPTRQRIPGSTNSADADAQSPGSEHRRGAGEQGRERGAGPECRDQDQSGKWGPPRAAPQVVDRLLASVAQLAGAP